MKFKKRIICVATLSALSLAVTSCGGGGGSSSNLDTGITEVAPTVQNGTVTLLATDAETDQFRSINLTITRAEMLAQDGGSEVLFEGNKTFDLLALADVTEVFSISEVPEGNYDKIRLTLTQIELVFHDDRDPVYPSLPGNGKLDINPRGLFTVDSEESLTIELDFDAEKSLKIVEQGNGGFSFRPVVFTRKVENEFDTKLIRQQGIIREFDEIGGDFLLCLPEDDEPEAGDEEDCVNVDARAGVSSIFGPTGLPAGLEQLGNGAIVTVVGRFFDAEDVMFASTSGTTVRALQSAVGTLDDDEFEGDEFEDDDSEDDEFEDDESEDDESEDDESEDDESEDDESEDDESEDDESEDDESEDDESEDDESEDDESEDDESEDDESEDDVISGLPRTLVADVIWLGDDFSRTENVACNEVTIEGDGMGFDNAQLPLVIAAECADVARLTVVTPGTRIYNEDGALLKSDEIGAGVINQVHGFVASEGEVEILRAAMIILSSDDGEEDERSQFTGTIGVIESQSLTLLTDSGDLCVVFEDDDTAVFGSSDSGGGSVFSEQTLGDLVSGQRVDAFGEVNEEGCIEADTIIYQAEDS
jgi:hypothetical protein